MFSSDSFTRLSSVCVMIQDFYEMPRSTAYERDLKLIAKVNVPLIDSLKNNASFHINSPSVKLTPVLWSTSEISIVLIARNRK